MDEPDVPVIHTGATAVRQGDESWRDAVRRLPDRPCVWCGGPTPLAAVAAFRPDLGPLPLHALCGADMREAFLAWRDGRQITDEMAAGMRRLSTLPAPALQPGSET